MQTAILKVLKDPNGTYSFPGGAAKAVPLFCSGVAIKPIEVLVDSSFTVHAKATSAGIIHAVELTCGSNHYFVLSTAKDIEALQSCCTDTINKTAALGCEAIVPVAVFNVLGANIGTANTPEEYATVWNADAQNSLVGEMFPLFNWTFRISVKRGSFIPLSLQCAEVTPPETPVCPSNVVVTSTTTETIHVAFTAEAHKNYTIRRYSDAPGNNILSSNNYSNSTGSSQSATFDITGLIGGGTFYVEVREAGSPTKCTIYSVVVAGVVVPQRHVEWNYFVDEPDSSALNGYTYPNSINHTINTNFSLDISAMQNDTWIVARFPSDETNVVAWFNTALNNGAIPDSSFLAIITVASWKYIKSRTALTFDTTQPLNFTH